MNFSLRGFNPFNGLSKKPETNKIGSVLNIKKGELMLKVELIYHQYQIRQQAELSILSILQLFISLLEGTNS